MKKAVPLKPEFESLEEPNTIIQHIKELTEKEEIKHTTILSKLLKEFKRIDFEKIANPSPSLPLPTTFTVFTPITSP